MENMYVRRLGKEEVCGFRSVTWIPIIAQAGELKASSRLGGSVLGS